MTCGVYTITASSGKQYIGSAVNVTKRWCNHRHDLRRGAHHSRALQRSWNKYGEKTFVFKIIIICAPGDRQLYEQIAFAALRPRYNISPQAVGNTLGRGRGWKHTEETRAKLSAAGKAWWDAASEEQRARAYPKQNSRKGIRLAPAHRALIATILTERNRSAEHRAKASKSRRGKPLSPAHRASLVAGWAKRRARPGHKDQLAAAWVKRKARQKQSDGGKTQIVPA